MNLNWHSAGAAVLSIALILVGGHFTAEALRAVVGTEFANELPGIAFAGFPALYASFEAVFTGARKAKRRVDSPGFRPWFVSGLTAAAIMVSFSQLLGGMLGLGLGMEEGILQARGVPGAIFEAVPLAQRLGSFIVCLMPLLLVAWGYYGSRVYSYTKSGIAFAAIFAVFSYAFINIVLALLTPLGKQALFPEGSFNILATMGAALTAVVLPAIGLAIGILIGWLRSGRSLARINTYIRGLATDKRNEAYLVLVAYFEEQSRRRDATTVVVEPPPANAQ